MNRKRKPILVLTELLITAVLILLDQWTKQLAVSSLMGQEDYVLIPGVLRFHYLENTGAAFSLLTGQQTFFLISTPIVACIILLIYFRLPDEKKFNYLRYVLLFIFAGAAGNYIDRFVQRYVVDFIYFELIDFPVFNVADIYVTVGMIILILLILFYYDDAELGKINPFRRKEEA